MAKPLKSQRHRRPLTSGCNGPGGIKCKSRRRQPAVDPGVSALPHQNSVSASNEEIDKILRAAAIRVNAVTPRVVAVSPVSRSACSYICCISSILNLVLAPSRFILALGLAKSGCGVRRCVAGSASMAASDRLLRSTASDAATPSTASLGSFGALIAQRANCRMKRSGLDKVPIDATVAGRLSWC